jgi:hypothetical protein
MWNTPTKKELSKIPDFYETENVPLKDKLIYLHFFIGSSDWYIAEYNKEQDLFWGFAILNGDHDCAEWGYISFIEMKQIKIGPVGLEIDCERGNGWKLRKASEIENIKKAQQW